MGEHDAVRQALGIFSEKSVLKLQQRRNAGSGVERIVRILIGRPASRASHANRARRRSGARERVQVIELRYFGGLSVEETAEAPGVSPQTVLRDWKLARAWLPVELRNSSRP